MTYGKYLALFAKNMIRFIDDQVYFEVVRGEEVQQGKWLVHQEIQGESPLFTAISANEDVFLRMASIYAEEELSEMDELAKASVSELLNLQNGIYEKAENTRDFSREMNWLRIGGGLCHALSNICSVKHVQKSTNIISYISPKSVNICYH